MSVVVDHSSSVEFSMGSSVTHGNLDIWQKVLALDTSFSYIRPSTCENIANRTLYLRRRNQLFKEHSRSAVSSSHGGNGIGLIEREKYRYIRERILTGLYGQPTSFKLQPNLMLQNVHARSDSGSIRRCPSNTPSLADFFEKNIDRESINSVKQSAAASGDEFCFSGIEHIFDHHKKAINRLQFANNDNTRLAIASADGTISICCAWPPDVEKRVLFRLSGGHQLGSAITDIAWSLANDFLVSTSLDGSVCVWNALAGVLTRHYSASSLSVGPATVCVFQPQNYNLLVVGGAWSVIQTLNLSTGKPIRKGRDQVHSAGVRSHKPHSTVSMPSIGCGCITAFSFDSATGTCFWVGTDRGVVQSYVCQPTNGHLYRTHRINFGSTGSRPYFNNGNLDSTTNEEDSGHPDQFGNLVSSLLTSQDKWSIATVRRKLTRLNKNDRNSCFLPSVTSLSFHSCLSREDRNAHLLASVAGLGLLLLQVASPTGDLLLKRRVSIPHQTPDPLSKRHSRLLHSCFAPLFAQHTGAFAITGSEDANVYVFDLFSKSKSQMDSTGPLNRVPLGLVTKLQGHMAPVMDVAIGWDESVLASSDENGLVIVWRRDSRKDADGE